MSLALYLSRVRSSDLLDRIRVVLDQAPLPHASREHVAHCQLNRRENSDCCLSPFTTLVVTGDKSGRLFVYSEIVGKLSSANEAFPATTCGFLKHLFRNDRPDLGQRIPCSATESVDKPAWGVSQDCVNLEAVGEKQGSALDAV
jgi:hypothetical protein